MSKLCFDLTAQVTVLLVEKPLNMSRQLTELCRYCYHNNNSYSVWLLLVLVLLL